MALTDHSDVYASFHEDGFNSIIQHIMLQRPSLFNYATSDLANPRYSPRVCRPIKYHSAVEAYSNPLVSVEPYMPVPGYSGPFGLSYSFQLRELKIDFDRNNIIDLPAELKPLIGEQTIYLSGTVCGGMACPYDRFIDQLADEIKGQKEDDKRPNAPDRPFPFEEFKCFCLRMDVVLKVVRSNGFLQLQLLGLELTDIRPEGLECALECYISTLMKLTILPKMRIALSDLIFEMNSFISLVPTPISADVPFNPSVANDRVSVFFNLQ